jgi:cobalt/nickel transport system permease protein
MPHSSKTFTGWTLDHLADAMKYVSSAEDLAKADGLLQRVDPRIKVAGIAALILSVVFSHRLSVIWAVMAFTIMLGVSSKASLLDFAKRVFIPVMLFTGTIAIASIFTTPGDTLTHLPVFGWAITLQGLRSAGFLISRAEAVATLCAVLVLTTPWTHILKSLRVFRAPIVFVVILSMTYRYLFLLLQTAHDMVESRHARTVGRLEPSENRRIATATMGVLLSKSFQLSSDVHLAMQSRGFRGELYLLDDFQATSRDWAWLAGLLGISGAAMWLGR